MESTMKLHYIIICLFFCISNLTAQMVGGQGRNNKTVVKKKSYLFDNGFFLDGTLGVGIYSVSNRVWTTPEATGFDFNFRLGNKWYFSNMTNYRPGFQATWIRTGASIIPYQLHSYTQNGQVDNIGNITNTNNNYDFSYNATAAAISFAPCLVGMTNAIALTDEMGIEANVNIGFNLMITATEEVHAAACFIFNPCVKFRYKQFAVGLDIAHTSGTFRNEFDDIYRKYLTNCSLTVGTKF